MLENSFIHIPGISSEAEKSLWSQGCRTWRDYLREPERFDCDALEPKKLQSALKRSIKAKQTGEHQFFKRKLGIKHSWRAFPDFRDSCVYLDIETDGRSGPSSVTTIGLYDGQNFRVLLKDVDLGNFPDVISQYSMIVTFCGTGFDLPILQKRFPLTRLDQIHLDLHPTLHLIGHNGGLKKIEQDLGIERQAETQGLNGFDAVKLWRRYTQLRDSSALDLLIAYNREDVVNLERLAVYAYENLWRLSGPDSVPVDQRDHEFALS